MKTLKKIALLALMVTTMASCVEKEPVYGNFPGSKDVDFTYNVDGDEYTLDFYVVSTIKFNNTSSMSGDVTWDFGDGTTSTDQNPTHKFAKAGIYNVSLTVDGVARNPIPCSSTTLPPCSVLPSKALHPLSSTT